MTKPFIVLGDTSSHGGTVQTATTGFTVNGTPVAGHGDTLECPIHGLVTIQATGNGMKANGKSPARDGDNTSCGACLIASQKGVTWQGDARG
ncbi:PAAR domain-containing protein [Pseudomonas entomophila]|uniref:PAAR domain-containing protein n=1 Tax=Pseudomonas entomophila TaxID=312306 RepID=UPI0023D82D5F|nr:PAAR domain-containing protein [Pseudomonas entomophila]MDF0729245.1 PAAR domain-containing protein [Pseudomonas entomophila]